MLSLSTLLMANPAKAGDAKPRIYFPPSGIRQPGRQGNESSLSVRRVLGPARFVTKGGPPRRGNWKGMTS